MLEGMSVTDETIGKLIFSIHRNSLELINDKTKTKDMIRLEKHLTESLSYLNASVKLNVVVSMVN